MLNGLNNFRLSIADFLNNSLIDSGIIFINYWHIIHFLSGMIVMFFIIKIFKNKNNERKLIILFALLLIYELFEITFILNGSSFFVSETFFDVVLDIASGFLGGFLFLRFKKQFLINKH